MLTVLFGVSAHFIGGLLITFGLFTRWAIMVQLLILIGTITINFVDEMNTTNLYLDIATMLICRFLLVYGSVKYPLDYYFKIQQ